MRTMVICAALVLLATGASAQNRLTVNVSGIEKQTGDLYISVTDRTLFLTSGVDGRIVPVDGESMTVVFESIPDGEYAVMIYHDENGNRQLDMKPISEALPIPIPAEPYGYSNNFVAKQGPPTFDDLKFTLDGDRTEEVKLQKLVTDGNSVSVVFTRE